MCWRFVVLVHAACWIHAERPLAKLLLHNDEHRAPPSRRCGTHIWELYQAFKGLSHASLDEIQRSVLEARFDALVEQRTGYPSIDGVLKEMREHKADLLHAC